MKIFNDKTTPGYIPEKNETQGRISKSPKSGSEKNVQVVQTSDELELSSQKVPVMSTMRETDIGGSPSFEFDAGDVPMIKQKISFVNGYILNNPLEALSAQANLNSESVARLVG